MSTEKKKVFILVVNGWARGTSKTYATRAEANRALKWNQKRHGMIWTVSQRTVTKRVSA